MDKREEPYGEYSPAEEEQFRRDLELALELSLQEQTIVDYNTELEWALREDLNVNVNDNVDVSRPAALPKDHPVAAEIRADVEDAEVSELRKQLTQSNVRDDAAPEKMVLERLSQASSWAQRDKSERGRGAQKASPQQEDGDRDTIPNLDEEVPCRDVDHIPRRPVGQGALKKVPRKQQQQQSEDDHSESSEEEPPTVASKLPAQRVAPATILRAQPEGEAALPQDSDDAGWRTPPSDTEEFLRDLEIARQNSLLVNWAPTYGNEPTETEIAHTEEIYGMETEASQTTSSYPPDLPIKPVVRKHAPPKSTKVDTNAHASAAAENNVADSKPSKEIFDWLSNAQRHDPQLVKITKAIKDYLARTGKKQANQPCKYCPDTCECVYVTSEYLQQFGMEELVRNSSDVELLSGSDLEFTSSGEHKLNSPQHQASVDKASRATDQLRRRHGAVGAQDSIAVQQSSSEDASAQDSSDPDPAAFVERWYTTVLQGQSSGSEPEVNNNATDQGSTGMKTDTPMRMVSVEHVSQPSAKSQEKNGWTSRRKYGNEKLGIGRTPSWNTARRVWSPVAEDTLKLRPTSEHPSLFQTLPAVNYYPPEEENNGRSNQPNDDSSDAVETDSESSRDWCPDTEKTEKF